MAVEGDDFSADAVESVEAYYGLNREELCCLRREWYDILTEFREDLENPDLSAHRQEQKKGKLKGLIGPDRPHTGMARHSVHGEWGLVSD